MPEVSLRLSHRSGPPRAADAWYVPSGDVGQWLAEIAAWAADHAKVAIVPLARDANDLAPAGALLIPPTGSVAATPRCVPFARLARDFYIPADADVVPQLESPELAALLSGDYIHVWRAGAGLTAAERSDVLHVHELLAPGARRDRRWNRAVAGVAYPQRLTALVPLISLDLQSIFEEGRDDIATDSEIMDKLPKAPNEPGSGILQAGAQGAMLVMGGALFGLSKLFSGVAKAANVGGAAGAGANSGSAPRGVSAKGPGKLGKFLNEKFAGMTRSLLEARHKELTRLLHMLDKDPEKGLRFAIPFAGSGYRGRARPGSRLTERLLNFSLSGLGGGAPVDFWDMPPDYQMRLRTKYHELANREIRLNRHRRAAYIFAELLGDIESAAAALRDGKHYREAAVIYRDRLKRPLDAARCLEGGGLWAEAIAEYEQLEMHEKVGDLYAGLDDRPRAEAAYQTAAAEHRDKADYLAAARITEEKLVDPERAAVDLETGWLNSRQGLQCMRALFDLFGRRGWHADAIDRSDDLVAEAANSQRDVAIAELLAEFARGYPDVAVREATTEGAKRVIGGRLRDSSVTEAEVLCRTLARLAPDDRLLDRDVRRYTSREKTAAVRPVPAIAPAEPGLRVIATWSFGSPGVWQTAAVGGATLFLAGIQDNRVVITRSTLSGEPERVVTLPSTPVGSEAKLILIPERSRGDRLGVVVLGGPVLPEVTAFQPTEALPFRLKAGSLRGVSSPIGATSDANGVTLVAEGRNGGTLVAIDDQGRLLATHRLPLELVEEPLPLLLPMVARNDRYYLGLGGKLVTLQGDGEPQQREMPGRIVSLCAAAPYTLNRIAVSLDLGARMIWDGSGLHHERPFADHMAAPVLGFNRGGYVMAASGADFEVYDTKNGNLVRVAAGSLKRAEGRVTAEIIAVFAVPAPNRFGLVDQTGTATVYEICARR